MIFAFAGGLIVGCLMGEYYRRIIDRIRREQIGDLKSQGAKSRVRYVVDRPPQHKARPLVSEAQFAEMRTNGRTGGRYAGGEHA